MSQAALVWVEFLQVALRGGGPLHLGGPWTLSTLVNRLWRLCVCVFYVSIPKSILLTTIIRVIRAYSWSHYEYADDDVWHNNELLISWYPSSCVMSTAPIPADVPWISLSKSAQFIMRVVYSRLNTASLKDVYHTSWIIIHRWRPGLHGNRKKVNSLCNRTLRSPCLLYTSDAADE